jgi:heme-binding protein
MIKKILMVLLALLIIIQFFRPAKNISTTAAPNDIALHFTVPDNVHDVLKKSCYDCHSNNTAYPWYNNIQPVAWWLQNHVSEGKHELNFNEFASYPAKKQYHKLKSIIDSQNDGWMPLDSYLWIHKDAILDKEQKESLIKWADSLSREIKAKNNLPDEPEHEQKD